MKTGAQEPKDRPELLRHRTPKSNAPWHCRQTLPMFALRLTACATPPACQVIPPLPSVDVEQPQVRYSLADGHMKPTLGLTALSRYNCRRIRSACYFQIPPFNWCSSPSAWSILPYCSTWKPTMLNRACQSIPRQQHRTPIGAYLNSDRWRAMHMFVRRSAGYPSCVSSDAQLC